MPHTLLKHLFRRLHGLAGSQSVPDAVLLEDYTARGDQKAFELLVWRHGAMVLQTCRRIVLCPHEAEDAFQAVFWILARKAGTIRRRAALPAWLHRIAVRVALAAKQRRGTAVSLDAIDEPTSPPTERDPALDLLDEEINRLPLKYRLPIVLCHLEEKNGNEAAQELGIPQGTLYSRLARGREKLRVRLERRGIALGAGSAMVLEQSLPAASSCAAPLVEKTVAGALAFAAARSAELSSPILALAKGVLHAMWLRNLAVLSVSVVLIGSFVTGAWFALQPAAAQDQPTPVAQVAPQENKLPKLLKERYESAARTYEANYDEYLAGRTVVIDRCLLWSLKMLEAELDLKPAERVKAHVAHFDRMRQVYEIAKKKFDVGVMGPAQYGFAEHGLLEAELWLEREKAKK